MGKHRRLRARAWTSRWRWPLILGGGAAVLFFINARQASATPAPTPSGSGGTLPPPAPSGLPIQAGTQNIPELPASMAPTAPELTASGSFWDNLQPVASLSSGYINFPSGAQSAAALFPARMDASGNYYVQWSGLVYVLGNQDSSGNWPAQAVG